jgi:hypothetical protein
MYAKKMQKYANNPQKYAKTHKSKQFAISALFVLNTVHNSTQFLFLVGLPTKAFNAQYAQYREQRLIL